MVNQFGDESCPSCLMAGADARSIIAMEILIKEDVILPVRILLEFIRPAKDRPLAGFIS